MTREQFITEAKKRGKKKEDIRAKYEALDAQGAFDDSEPTQQKQPGMFDRMAEAQRGVVNETSARNQRIADRTTAEISAMRGTALAGPMQALSGYKGAFELAGSTLAGAASLPISAIGAAVKPAVNNALQSSIFKNKEAMQYVGGKTAPIAKAYASLPEDVKDLGTAIGGVSTIAGLPGVAGAKSYIGRSATITPKGKAINFGIDLTGKDLKSIALDKAAISTSITPVEKMSVKEIRKSKGTPIEGVSGETVVSSEAKIPLLKDISEAEYRAIERPKAPEVIGLDKYIKQQELADKEVGTAKTAYQLSGQNTVKAFDEIDELRKKAGKDLDAAIKSSADKKVNISDIKKKYYKLIRERIGGMEDGEIPISATEAKAAKEMEDFIFSIAPDADNLTVQDAHRLKRYLRENVKYDANGQYRADTGTLQGIMKEISDDIDKKLDVLVPGYKKANQDYAQYVSVEDLLGKALGQKINGENSISKMGTSVMKRGLESLANSGIDEIFAMVKKVTNGKYDPMQDALYASIAMRLSKEPRYREQAARFGKIMAEYGMPVEGRALNLAGKAVSGIREKGKSQRLADWYIEQQKKHSESIKTKQDISNTKQTTAQQIYNETGTIKDLSRKNMNSTISSLNKKKAGK